ncbi:hypothetical protein RRG08_001635 [Elysia crispata]|uniref:Uncharacterized protein n=1 Tax=Elysia crispata TaxID=231223 RepID=A0AAE1AJX5_9GAST|nr:hypothetical protein RRG08_001635 [Elysia crispata]
MLPQTDREPPLLASRSSTPLGHSVNVEIAWEIVSLRARIPPGSDATSVMRIPRETFEIRVLISRSLQLFSRPAPAKYRFRQSNATHAYSRYLRAFPEGQALTCGARCGTAILTDQGPGCPGWSQLQVQSCPQSDISISQAVTSRHQLSRSTFLDCLSGSPIEDSSTNLGDVENRAITL